MAASLSFTKEVPVFPVGGGSFKTSIRVKPRATRLRITSELKHFKVALARSLEPRCDCYYDLEVSCDYVGQAGGIQEDLVISEVAIPCADGSMPKVSKLECKLKQTGDMSKYKPGTAIPATENVFGIKIVPTETQQILGRIAALEAAVFGTKEVSNENK